MMNLMQLLLERQNTMSSDISEMKQQNVKFESNFNELRGDINENNKIKI